MNIGLLYDLYTLSQTKFPSNLELSITPETSIIESEPVINIEESTMETGTESQGDQLLNDELISSQTSDSSSNPEEKLGDVNNTASTSTTDPTSSLLSFDIGSYTDDLIVIAIMVLASISIYLIIHFTLKRVADSLNIKERRIKGIDSLVKTMIIVISAIIILFHFSTLSATAAGFISIAVGSIIGFSSRNTISNAIAGIILLSSKPFKLGDRIQAGNLESLGDVIEISLIFTKIKTIRNEMVTIPNQVLLQNQIKNYSGYKFLVLSIQVSAGFNEDQEIVKSLLLKAANNTYGVLKEPKPYVLLKELGDFAAIYELMVYTEKAHMTIQIKSDLRVNVYKLFKESSIDLTTPRIVDSYRIHDAKNDSGLSLPDEQ